jgi:beta-lactamase superfamily II metal-dependent hydrolase
MDGLELFVFDVEHGNAISLVLPNQSRDRFLFDIGNRANFSPARHLATKYGREIRCLTITHPDADHISDVANVSSHLGIGMLVSHEEITQEFLYEYHGGNVPEIVQNYIDFKSRFYNHVPGIEDPCYNWGGVKFAQFHHGTKDFSDINNLSIVTFIDYAGWVILLPGDLEKSGWLKHLESESFRGLLARTDIFVASHHGRDNGYCEEVFKYCKPHLVIVSDKGITETSCTDRYCWQARGLEVSNLGESRKVLTTRFDGAISLHINPAGQYTLSTFTTGS